MSDYREKFRPTPGTLLREEAYKEIATHLDDHPEYVEYARGSRFIIPGEIMDTWINGNITNESVYSCVPFFARNTETGKSQGIHYSQDLWRETNTDDFVAKLKEWEAGPINMALIRNKHSRFGESKVTDLSHRFKERVVVINLDRDETYHSIYVPEKEIIVVQFTKPKIFRVYQAF